MKSVGLFAYGEMGPSAIQALVKTYTISWIVLPKKKLQTASEKSTERFATQYQIPILYSPSRIALVNHVLSQTPDLIVISSFNQLLPDEVIQKTTCINIHIGDLPRYRGRANVNWAIINNRSEIGLTVHSVVADLDAGNIYRQVMIPILFEDTVKTVYEKIDAFLRKELQVIVQKVVDGYEGKAQKGTPTYCCTRLPEDGLIDWKLKTMDVYNLIRALTTPYPGAFTYFDGNKLIIFAAEFPKNPKKYEGSIAGRIVSIIPGKGVEVLTGDGSILITEVEYDGKQQNAAQIINTVKKTLGINWVELYEKMQKLEKLSL